MTIRVTALSRSQPHTSLSALADQTHPSMPSHPESPIRISIPPVLSSAMSNHSSNSLLKPGNGSGGIRERRGRSGSLVEVQEVGYTEQDILDQSAYQNNNPEWVNAKGMCSFCVIEFLSPCICTLGFWSPQPERPRRALRCCYCDLTFDSVGADVNSLSLSRLSCCLLWHDWGYVVLR